MRGQIGWKTGVASLLSLSVAAFLQGCGGGSDSPTPQPNPTPRPFTPSPTRPPLPFSGFAYGALPCSPQAPCDHGKPAEDVTQDGYAIQWGPKGRDDLGAIKKLGAGGVRLYHSIGAADQSSQDFLDYAYEIGLNVYPGIDTDLTRQCTKEMDCFDVIKDAVLKAFNKGYRSSGGDSWHEAVSMIILLNEPDFLVNDPNCPEVGAAWCRVKAALSALDGLLAAEKEAEVDPGGVNLSITWSAQATVSIDGQVFGPGCYGFQDMVAAVANPSLAHYTPRTSQADLAEAFRTRWVHALNAQAPYSAIQNHWINGNECYNATLKPHGSPPPDGTFGYSNLFGRGRHPWYIGEHGMLWQSREIIEGDLLASNADVEKDPYYLGLFVFQFQQAFEKGGSELNFGIFNLGNEKIGDTGSVCDHKAGDNPAPERCETWPVYCRKTTLNRGGNITDEMDHRAEAVEAAWKGTLDKTGMCKGTSEIDAEELLI